MNWEDVTITDIVQAVSSVVGAFIALVALLIARRSMNVTVHTFVRPLRLNSTTGGDRSPIIILKNVGPGVAYEVKCYLHPIKNVTFNGDEVIFNQYQYVEADALTDMQPNTSGAYKFKDDETGFVDCNLTKPIILKYQLASGKEFISYWRHEFGLHKNTFIRLNAWEVTGYKLQKAWTTLYVKYRMWKFKRKIRSVE